MGESMNGAFVAGPASVVAPCWACGVHHAAGTACPVERTLQALTEVTALAPGTVLAGRFKLREVAHRSGMSTVYRAIDISQGGAEVAVKAVAVHGLSYEEQKEARSWLAREAGLLSSLANPHLPTLTAAFSEGENHFVVMPFLRGETLKERVEQSGVMPQLEALRMGHALAEALVYLHGQQPAILHRDLKPTNILLTQVARSPDRPTPGAVAEEAVVLLDLGVARPLAAGVVGTAIGTPGFAPPEQYQGLMDERSDLYALGATLHYALTGYDFEHEAPFHHPSVRGLKPHISAEFGQLIDWLLDVAPNRRPPSAAWVTDYLGHMVEIEESANVRTLNRRFLLAALLDAAFGTGWLSAIAVAADLHRAYATAYFVFGAIGMTVQVLRRQASEQRKSATPVPKRIRALTRRFGLAVGAWWFICAVGLFILPVTLYWIAFCISDVGFAVSGFLVYWHAIGEARAAEAQARRLVRQMLKNACEESAALAAC